MSTTVEPIRGLARIDLPDVIRHSLIVLIKRLAVQSLFAVAIFAYLGWQVYAHRQELLGDLDFTADTAVMRDMRDPLIFVAWGYAALLLALLVLWVVVFPAIGLWRLGRERRALTWIIDETGIHRTDALGAQSLLPWSNILKVRFSRRMVWVKVKPRGWRFLLLRAFSSEDQQRLRQLATRMVP